MNVPARMTRVGLILLLALAGCDQQPTVSTTRGKATVECDESLAPVMQFQAEDFHNTYPEGFIQIRLVDAREAVVNFVNDSIRVIVLARAFNKEEMDYIKDAKIEYEGYKVAMDAVAVVVNKQNPATTLRLTELDSIYSSTVTRWSAGKKPLIDAYVGDINSSTDEVFRATILKGKPFGPTVTRVKSSGELLEKVKQDPGGIGLVGVSWLKGHDQEVTVCRLGGGSYQPDTTVVMGQFYSPAQAHVLRKYYPLWKEVYMYTREVRRDVSYGFIAYVKDRKGQQNFINHGLVPTAVPVRMVDLTSQKVQQR